MEHEAGTRKVHWTPAEAEMFWRVCYANDLEASQWLSRVAPLIAGIVARRYQRPARVAILGDRDPALAEALLGEGFHVGRIHCNSWLRTSTNPTVRHERWLGAQTDIENCRYDLVVSVGILECVPDSEVAPFLYTLRAAATDADVLIVTSNAERLEQHDVVCPITGILFHKDQRVRTVDRRSLAAMMAGAGLETSSMLEIELDLDTIEKHAAEDPTFAMGSETLVGAGTTLFAFGRAVALPDGLSFATALKTAYAWLEARRTADRIETPTPKRWSWTASSVDRFWSRIAGTALDELSFGKINGRTMLGGIEPWLVPGGRHLDVGAGEGHMAAVMASSGYPVAVFEPAPGRAKTIEEKLGGSAGFLGRLDRLDDTSKNTFDVVLACEVIEHVLDEDLQGFFALLSAALKPDGRVIISTPNAEDIRRGEVYSPFGNVIFHRWQHVRSLSPHGLEALLRRYGFEPDVVHEVELATAETEAEPLLAEILGSNRHERHGNASNLIAIARLAGAAPLPPRRLSASERKIPSHRGRACGTLNPGWAGRSLSLEPALVIEEIFELDVKKAEVLGKHGRRLLLPNHFLAGDNVDDTTLSRLRLFEDGKPLGPGHTARQLVAALGRGRYAHWGRELDFSSSDGSDPATNGRRYVAVADVTPVRTVNLDHRLERNGSSIVVWEVPASEIRISRGRMCEVCLPTTFSIGDEVARPNRSNLELFEDGRPLGPAHASHGDIDLLGGGRFSHWQNRLLFSTSDGIDPRSSGRRYFAVADCAAIRPVKLAERLGTVDEPIQIWELPAFAIEAGIGRQYAVTLPKSFAQGGNSRDPDRSSLELFEDDEPLGPAHALHDDIRQLGCGRFSHWRSQLLFSTSDCTDPRTNNRRYMVVARIHQPRSTDVRRMVSKAIRSGYKRLLPAARAALPVGVKARLQKPVGLIEAVLARRERNTILPLRNFTPALVPETFVGGPIVLCNNALAWGGVERQVVNTLRGIAKRLEKPPQLLCVRLGYSSDYDFYKAALVDYPGDVRNAIDAESARRSLEQLEKGLAHRIAQATAWLPIDVQEEILRFAGDFATIKPSVVHVWQDGLSISAGYAARMIGVPKIVISSRNMAARRFAYHRPYMADAYREMARCEDIVMLNNSAAGARDYADWLGVSFERYQIIRNGIDSAEISPPPLAETCQLRASLGLSAQTPVVGSIFRFYAEKQPRLWIATAARIAAANAECHFVVFGTGPMRDEMLDYAAKHGFARRLHLPGTISNAALGLSIMNVFMLTSELEGTPNVVLEASLMGVPVVATDAGGTAETIDDGVSGFVAAVPDAGRLADLVLLALRDSTWRERVRTAGPQFVLAKFGLDRMIEETLDTYGMRK